MNGPFKRGEEGYNETDAAMENAQAWRDEQDEEEEGGDDVGD